MPITALTTVAFVVLLTALSVQVSRLRLRYRVSYGHGDHRDLEAAIRAHGNCLEQGLVFLLLLLLSEWTQPPAPWLALAGLGFVAVRVLYAAAVFLRKLRLRQLMHMLTVALQLLLALSLAGRTLP